MGGWLGRVVALKASTSIHYKLKKAPKSAIAVKRIAKIKGEGSNFVALQPAI
ncbi:hypothetical protein [Helicobacter suis]|uniref:hypothetical protein n=1 Tax=Helicobacter suis TaxID=104628 RepID=UPI00220988D1|nr:hypothetical protein [Helicobacter suis]BDR28125.1 hypothetical protein HSHS1_08860 [Helicobacter suis HS1]